MLEHKRIIVVCGHYGCGKTNLSVNLAIDFAGAGEEVVLVDMDVVNPYFRSYEYGEEMRSHGVEVIAPTFAGSTLDVPALLPEINSVFDSGKTVIFDAGGDDVGATALGCFYRFFKDVEYDMWYVVNKYRALTKKPEEAAEILREIEAASRLRATAVVNNSHLKAFTTKETVLDSVPFADETAKILGLPVKFTTAPRSAAEGLEIENLYPVEIYVRSPWE